MPWSLPPLLWLCLGVLVPPCPAAAVQDAAEEPAVRLAAILTEACAAGARTAIEQYLPVTSLSGDGSEAEPGSGGCSVSASEVSGQLRDIQQRLQALQPAPERCPEAWSRHGDSCYFIPPRRTNWYLAHHVCASLDRRARLASVHPGSSQFIETLVESFGAEIAVWMGLADAGGSWVWSDGSPLDYVNWHAGEPNLPQEKCAHFGWVTTRKATWFDNSCSAGNINVLCQIDLKPNVG